MSYYFGGVNWGQKKRSNKVEISIEWEYIQAHAAEDSESSVVLNFTSFSNFLHSFQVKNADNRVLDWLGDQNIIKDRI